MRLLLLWLLLSTPLFSEEYALSCDLYALEELSDDSSSFQSEQVIPLTAFRVTRAIVTLKAVSL